MAAICKRIFCELFQITNKIPKVPCGVIDNKPAVVRIMFEVVWVFQIRLYEYLQTYWILQPSFIQITYI